MKQCSRPVKPSVLITVDTEKKIIRYEREKETIHGNQGAWLNDQSAAKTSIDFSVKYTAQLKIQLIIR